MEIVPLTMLAVTTVVMFRDISTNNVINNTTNTRRPRHINDIEPDTDNTKLNCCTATLLGVGYIVASPFFVAAMGIVAATIVVQAPVSLYSSIKHKDLKIYHLYGHCFSLKEYNQRKRN